VPGVDGVLIPIVSLKYSVKLLFSVIVMFGGGIVSVTEVPSIFGLIRLSMTEGAFCGVPTASWTAPFSM